MQVPQDEMLGLRSMVMQQGGPHYHFRALTGKFSDLRSVFIIWRGGGDYWEIACPLYGGQNPNHTHMQRVVPKIGGGGGGGSFWYS